MDDRQHRETAKPTPRFQFGLKHLMALPVVLAVFFGIASCLGVGEAFVILWILATVIGTAGLFYSATRRVSIVGLAFLLITPFLLPTWSRAGPEERKAQCRNHLKQIVLALHAYHDEYGSFPPAYAADEYGRPMHSWRVLILPFFEQRLLYEQYDFNEPWDGPSNSRLADQVLHSFQCLQEPWQMTPTTSYVAVVGPGTMWPGSEPMNLDECSDDPSNTILVVEIANSDIHWMEPRDLDISEMPLEVNPKNGRGISSLYPGSRFPRKPRGAQVALADGSVRFLPENTQPEELRAMLTGSGGD